MALFLVFTSKRMEIVGETPLRRFVVDPWPQHQKKCLAVQAFRAKRKAREAEELEAHGMDTER